MMASSAHSHNPFLIMRVSEDEMNSTDRHRGVAVLMRNSILHRLNDATLPMNTTPAVEQLAADIRWSPQDRAGHPKGSIPSYLEWLVEPNHLEGFFAYVAEGVGNKLAPALKVATGKSREEWLALMDPTLKL